jgi:hypothetical protein
VLWHLGQDNLERWPYAGLQKMAALRRSVSFTHNHVSVNIRLPVFQGNVTDERKDLDLIVDWDLFVCLLAPIEIILLLTRLPPQQAENRQSDSPENPDTKTKFDRCDPLQALGAPFCRKDNTFNRCLS